MEDIVPARVGGAHSSVGRATNRGMDKMRELPRQLELESRRALEVRKEVAERIAAERVQGIPETQRGAKPPAPKGSGEEEGSPARRKTAVGAKYPVAPDKAVSSTPMGRAVRERLNLNVNPGSQEPVIGSKEPQSPLGLSLLPEDNAEKTTSPTSPTNKASPAFTTCGAADQVFHEGARVALRRFFLQGKNRGESSPDIGHYRVQHKAIDEKIKTWDFGARAKHPSRSQPELRDTTRELGPEDLMALSYQWNSSGSLFAHPSMFSTSTHGQNQSMSESTSSWKGQSLMSTSVERPGPNSIDGSRHGLTSKLSMQELRQQEIEDMDRERRSKVQRVPECDLKKQLKRPNMKGAGCEHFEAGKYAVNHDAVLPQAKKYPGFHHQMSRSATAPHQKGQLGSLADAHHPDRSVYRQALISRPRTTHIMDMEKDLDRPPMFGSSQILHDTSDPEICRMVHEGAMTFDADTVDAAVRPRLLCSQISKITREKAGFGSRMRKSYGDSDTVGQAETPVEKLKDSCRIKLNSTMTFDQCKARRPTRLKGVYSALHRPRDHAAPDFFRAAPFDGFNTRTPVARTQKVHPGSRSFDAMPGWSVETVDVLMKSDVDG